MILSFASVGPSSATAAWVLGLPSVVAALGYALAAWHRDSSGQAWRTALLIGWLAHAVALGVDITGIGSEVVAARFGFAPALSMTAWLVLAVYAIESRHLPLPGARRALAGIGVAVVLLAWSFPGDVRPQVASPWAPLHWILGFASYGLFGAAVLHAAMLSRAERSMRKPAPGAAPRPIRAAGIPLLQLERLTFRFVAAGFVVLSAALALGAWSAGPWRWDHKAVFSVLAWAVFAALLAGRRAFGWRGPAATRGLYAGAGLLLLAYVGSRFVLEVLLHRVPA